MKFVIPTIGTRGDIQPYIALALGLQSAGQETLIVSHPVMRDLVNSYGIPFSPMGPDIDIARETAIIRGRSRNWMIGFSRVMKFSFAMLEQSHTDLLALCRNADRIVVTHTAAGSIEADQLDLPHVSVTLMPQAIPVYDPDEPWMKRAVGKVAGAGMGLMMSRPLDKIRKRVGVRPMGVTGITSPTLNLIPVSPNVISPNPLWEPRHRMTGYWFVPSPEDWIPPQDLMEFLDAGEQPIVISLGAMALGGRDAMEAAIITINAVQKSGMRAVIQGWDDAMKTLSIPPCVFHGGSIPHDWLLNRASAVVHHGGFGTTSAGFQAGIPSLVIPHIIDQFLWGQQVAQLGVGPQPIPRTKLSEQNLTAALVQMKEDKDMREKAFRLGEKIRAEQGVKEAVRQILESDPM